MDETGILSGMKRRHVVSDRIGLGVALGGLISFLIDGIVWPALGLAVVLGATTPAYEMANGLYAIYVAEPTCADDDVLEEVSRQLIHDGWDDALPTGERAPPGRGDGAGAQQQALSNPHPLNDGTGSLQCEAAFEGPHAVPLTVRYSVEVTDRSIGRGRVVNVEVTGLARR